MQIPRCKVRFLFVYTQPMRHEVRYTLEHGRQRQRKKERAIPHWGVAPFLCQIVKTTHASTSSTAMALRRFQFVGDSPSIWRVTNTHTIATTAQIAAPPAKLQKEPDDHRRRDAQRSTMPHGKYSERIWRSPLLSFFNHSRNFSKIPPPPVNSCTQYITPMEIYKARQKRERERG